MYDKKTYRLINELYFYFIDHLNIRDICLFEKEDYSEHTDVGRELYRIIEKEVLKHYGKVTKNDLNYIKNQDVKKLILHFSKTINKRKLH
jgi:hypothetical protein